MSKQQKQIALIAGGLILAYLAYRWYAGRQGSNTTTDAVAPNSSGGATSSDYAALAGQEQADYAALQSDIGGVLSQEQGDVSGIQGTISGLTATVGGWTDSINSLITGQTTLGKDVAALASGQAKMNRAATVHTKKGGAFYKYYVKVTGKAPPATLSSSNFVYQGWKAGASAAGLKNVLHPSSKNTQVAHPNGGHTQQGHTTPSSDKNKTNKPPASNKSKTSGTRK